MARILFWTVLVLWICSFEVWPKKKPQALFSTEIILWKILTCLFQGVSEKDLMLPVNAFLLTSTYPYVTYDKIINETMLLSSIPKSSRQITPLQYHIHCVNCDTILFEQCYSSTLKPSLQLLHKSSAQYLQDTTFYHLYNTYNMNWIPPQKGQNTKQFKLPGKKNSSLKEHFERL